MTIQFVFGQTLTYKGQHYECIRFDEHTRRDGTLTELAVWKSRCAQCGEPFEFRTPSGVEVLMLNRRCRKHQKPGIPVRAKRK